MKKPLIFFILLFFISCANRQVYVNKSGSCKLKLYSDSTYYLKYPTFLKKKRESGTYQITGSFILLKHGQKEMEAQRKFVYLNDTVVVKGIDPKAIGSDRKLIKR